MRNKKVMGMAGLAAIMVVGGTFAYYNQELSITNPFDTGKYDSVIVEDFKPSDGDNWEPGVEINKDIEVKNTGDYDLLVRVRFDEEWVNKSDASWTIKHEGMNAETGQEDANDGLIANDKSVVLKNLNNSDKWVYNSVDGYWYYKEQLPSKQSTGVFLDSVKLLENADMGRYIVKNYYTTAEQRPSETLIGENESDATTKWVAYDTTKGLPNAAKHSMSITELDENAKGYGNADYTLTITAQTVQATDSALSVFGLQSMPEGCDWKLSTSNN